MTILQYKDNPTDLTIDPSLKKEDYSTREIQWLKKLKRIVTRLKFQQQHRTLQVWEYTYFSSQFAISLDRNYKKNFDRDYGPFGEIVSDSYSQGAYCKTFKRNLAAINTVFNELCKLPVGFFVDKKVAVERLNAKTGIASTACPLRQDLFTDAVQIEALGLNDHDKEYLKAMKLNISPDDACLWTEYRKQGERAFAMDASLQGASSRLRDFLLKNTGYVDIDAKASYNCDFEYLVKSHWFKAGLTKEQKELLLTFSGKDSRDAILSWVSDKDLEKINAYRAKKGYEQFSSKKLLHLAILFGNKNADFVYGEETMKEYRGAKAKLTKYMYNLDSFKNLCGYEERTAGSLTDKELNKVLSRMLCRMETFKISKYAELLADAGYEVMSYQFDGLIINKKISPARLRLISNEFRRKNWNSPLVIKAQW
jgi:hypothetical protein